MQIVVWIHAIYTNNNIFELVIKYVDNFDGKWKIAKDAGHTNFKWNHITRHFTPISHKSGLKFCYFMFVQN
jgi:hypothetical protein